MTQPHALLAQRIKERAPGTEPKPGESVGYIWIKNRKETIVNGKKVVFESSVRKKDMKKIDQIEQASYVEEHKLPVDYDRYIEMLGKALEAPYKVLGMKKLNNVLEGMKKTLNNENLIKSMF